MQNICVVCGKTFESKKSKKYCSKTCDNIAKRQRKILREQNLQEGIDIDVKTCLICGQPFKPLDKAANNRSCCYDCMPAGHQLRRSEFIQKIKQARGNKCQRCGYSRCSAALEFHHLDPAKKEFTISNANFKLKDALRETKKCILLCSNCHRELHAQL
jgi:hypothetical protein